MVITPAPEAPAGPGLDEWLASVLIACLMGWGIYRLAALLGHVRWGVRAGFLAFISGLVVYSGWIGWVIADQSRLADQMLEGAALASLAGVLLGLLMALAWFYISRASHQNIAKEKT